MSDLDLDIRNYSLSDMERFFRLDKSFTASDVEMREYEIREQLLSSGHIDKRLKRDLIAFLKEVKDTIIREKCEKNKIQNPAIEKRLDPTPNYPNIPYPPSNVRENEILQRPTVPYVYTQNSDYLPGTLNPVQTRTLTQCISVDTRFRDMPYTTQSSDFAINIPNKVKKVLSMQLSSIEFSPASLYNISSSLKNNYLYITVSSSEFEEEFTSVFFLPDGQYNTQQLIDTLNAFFIERTDTPFSSLAFELDPYGSGRICLEATNDSIVYISLDFGMDEKGNSDRNTVDYSSKLGRVLGFTKRKYQGKTSYMGETAVNPNIAFSYIFLAIDDFQNHSPPSFVPVFQNVVMPTSVIARIVIPDKWENHNITFISEPRKYFGPIDLTRIQIRLLDSYGRVLDMNGADYSFCLLLNMVYDF
jgi:hypothetical protein